MIGDVGQLRRLTALAEAAYDAMYEARNESGAASCYSEAKEHFYDAIALAKTLGLTVTQAKLEARLAHVKAVFRSQFT